MISFDPHYSGELTDAGLDTQYWEDRAIAAIKKLRATAKKDAPITVILEASRELVEALSEIDSCQDVELQLLNKIEKEGILL